MRRIALAVFTIGSLAVAGQALAGPGGYRGGYHGRGYHGGGGGGNVAAALFGGAVLGIVAGSIISNSSDSREVVVERPVYVEPAPCYDSYRGVYVQCAAPVGYYAPPPAQYQAPYPQSGYDQSNQQQNYADRQDAPPQGRAEQSEQQYQQSLQTARAQPRQPVVPVYAGSDGRPMGDRYDGPAGNR
jgi:hypothetical protein